MTTQVPTGRERWGDLYRSGQTMQQIADSSGVSLSTVYYALRELGVRGRADHGCRYEEMYQKGHSLVEVGRHFGVSKQAVQQSLKAWGIKRRGHDGRPLLTRKNPRRSRHAQIGG